MADMRELGVVKIAAPCKRSWNKMQGDDQVRFCGDCRMNVYNLSAMTADDARSLLLQKEGRVCTRFFARADGTVLTANCPRGVTRQRRTLAFSIGALFTLLIAPVLIGARACSTDSSGGSFADRLSSSWYDLKVQLGLERPAMMGMMAPTPRPHAPPIADETQEPM